MYVELATCNTQTIQSLHIYNVHIKCILRAYIFIYNRNIDVMYGYILSFLYSCMHMGFPDHSAGKEPTCNAGGAGDTGLPLGREYPLEEGMATCSSILAGNIPRTVDPGGLGCMGSQRVGHNCRN